jgi:formylglycine-generating enzyme required for sulfatase activity
VVRRDPDFHTDMDRLIRGIEEAMTALRKRSAPDECTGLGVQQRRSAEKKSVNDPRADLSAADEQTRDASRPVKNKTSPRPIPSPEPIVSPARPPRRRQPLLLAVCVLGAILLGVIIYVVTDDGRIKVVVNDPKAVVKIDGGTVGIESLGAPITLRAGEHTLEVKWGAGEFQTRTFIVRRGDNEDLRVEYEPTEKLKSRADAKEVPSAASVPGDESKPTVPPKLATNASSAADSPQQITNSIGMTFTLIPAGEFLMGSSKAEDSNAEDNEMVNGQKHRVRITRPYYLAVTEVTQGQYRAVTNRSPSYFKGPDDLPVETVSCLDAVAFCNALNEKEGRPPFYTVNGRNVEVPDWNGKGYRLPTDAEWEYACRADNPARYSFGNDPGLLNEYAWYKDNSGSKTHPVGEKPANGFGLKDMYGNVWEWCFDRYEPDFYAKSPLENPVCLGGEASVRVDRGGGWSFDAHNARSARRFAGTPDTRNPMLGFRVARGR